MEDNGNRGYYTSNNQICEGKVADEMVNGDLKSLLGSTRTAKITSRLPAMLVRAMRMERLAEV